MKNKNCRTVRLVTVLCIVVSLLAMFIASYTAVFAAEPLPKATEAGLETVPLSFTVTLADSQFVIRVLGTWDDNSNYRPLVFLTGTVNKRAWEEKAFGEKLKLVIQAAVNSKGQLRFFLRRDPKTLGDLDFYALSFNETYLDLNDGSLHIKAAKKLANTEHRTTIAVNYPEAYEDPKELDDYTIKRQSHWGVSYKGRGYVLLYCELRNSFSIVK